MTGFAVLETDAVRVVSRSRSTFLVEVFRATQAQVEPSEHVFAEIRRAFIFRRRVLRWCGPCIVAVSYRYPGDSYGGTA